MGRISRCNNISVCRAFFTMIKNIMKKKNINNNQCPITATNGQRCRFVRIIFPDNAVNIYVTVQVLRTYTRGHSNSCREEIVIDRISLLRAKKLPRVLFLPFSRSSRYGRCLGNDLKTAIGIHLFRPDAQAAFYLTRYRLKLV